jgi:hypothetical protein
MVATLITGSDLTARKDARTIADLVSDSGSPISESAVANHPKVLIALEDAEGEVVGNLAAFGRYTVEALSELTGSAQSFLKRVIAEIAMINLIVRRPDLSSEDLERHEKIRTQWLDRLQQGNMILANEDTDNSAARVSVDGATLGETANLNMVRDRSRYFPNRVYPQGRNY